MSTEQERTKAAEAQAKQADLHLRPVHGPAALRLPRGHGEACL